MARRRNPRKRGVTRGRASATVASTRLTVLDAMQDLELFGPLVGGDSWASWRRCAAAIFGLTTGMTATDRRFIERCLGRRPPPRPAREAWLIIGRRGGKSRFAALVAVFLACVRDYTSVLALGERGVLMVIASDRRQAQVVHGYIAAPLARGPDAHAVHRPRDEGRHSPHQRHHDRDSHRQLPGAPRAHGRRGHLRRGSLFGPRMGPRIPTPRSSRPSARRWPPCRVRCCCASRPPTPGGESCGRPTTRTLASAATCSCGRPTRGP